ncbi:hypothetical protein INR49_012392 [Caranx melampygus]|nr:hypothetical protein INR49_012392 [Caranx melampygus]
MAKKKIPFEYLGLFGTFCRYLVDNYAGLMYKGWWAAFAIHVFEAVAALRVCSGAFKLLKPQHCHQRVLLTVSPSRKKKKFELNERVGAKEEEEEEEKEVISAGDIELWGR